MQKTSFLFVNTLIFLALITVSCKFGKNIGETDNKVNKPSVGVASPPVIVYKTKKDYSRNVPVILSEDKLKIVSFPAHNDIKKDNDFVYPTKLNNGYLLDNRGITQHAAFLKFTYEDYYNMDNIPDASLLMNYILDKEPFTEIYQCGRRGDYKNPEEELNQKIETGKLKDCKNLLK